MVHDGVTIIPWYTMVTPHSQLLPVMLAEAKTSRPRPRLGQSIEVEAEAEAKNNYETVENND